MKNGDRNSRALVVAACLGLALTALAAVLLPAAEGRDGAREPAPAAAPAPAAVGPVVGEGTRRMAQRLKDLADRADIKSHPYLNDRRVAEMRGLEAPTDPARRLGFEIAVAREFLRAGLTAEAIERFESVRDQVDAVPAWRDSAIGEEVHSLLAVSYLRHGEQQNCIRHHGSESCLLPIRGSGIHTDETGSRAAIREYLEILSRHPEDLRSRWLLNVAYMTVGGHPEEVPEKWLIPPSAFESEYDIGRFPEVAAEVGLDTTGLAGAALVEDFDGDGYLDVVVTSWGPRDPMHFFRNDRDGTFSDRTEEAGLTGITSGLNAVHADYDNDGDMDVFVPRGAWWHQNGILPPSLLRNRGDGWFEDVTETAGLLLPRPSQAVAWGDFDNDGWLDLYVAGETTQNGQRHPNSLYRNNRNGTFTDVAEAAGVAAVGFFKGTVWGDYDNDGRLDLFVTAHHLEPGNLLFHNDGPDAEGRWRFTDVTAQAGVRGPSTSFPTWFFDYDNDGWLDLLAVGFGGTVHDLAADYLGTGTLDDGETPRLYRNQGDGTFRDVTAAVRLDRVVPTMGSNFGDLDNDGWLDIYLGTGNPDFRTLIPNRMFRNAGGVRFQDVTTSGGFGHLQKAHGIAFGDLDNDGDQDVFLKVGGAFTGDTFQSALFENPGHGNHWITLRLVGSESNRGAIGARIKVTVEEAGATREIHRVVSTGGSFGGSPLRREIGLGQATRIRRIEIAWPTSGRRQVFEDVAMNRFLEIREDGSEPRPVPLDRLALGGGAAPAAGHPAHSAAHAGH